MEQIYLRDICDLDNGYAFKSDDYVSISNTLNCRMSNIRPDGSFDIMYNAKYLPDEYAEKYKEYLLKDGDLIIAMTDMAGDPKILGVPTVVDTKGYNLLLNQRVGKLRFLKDSVNEEYLKLTLQSKKVRSYLKRFAGGGVQLNVSKKDILNTPVQIKSKEEQEYIVTVFTKLKSIINQRKKELLKLDELIKSRFVKLFGTPLLNEKGWGVKNTGDVCSVTDGSHFSPAGKEEGYPMLSVRNMRNDGFHYDDCKLVSQEDYDILVKQGCKPLKNDVLIAKDGSYFYYGFVVKEEIEQAVLSSIAILRPNLELINPEYLCRYMLSSEIVDLVGKNYVTGAAIKRVILKGIKQIPVMLPPIELQNQFAAFVEQTDKSKFVIQKSIDELQTLYDSLMQEYFG